MLWRAACRDGIVSGEHCRKRCLRASDGERFCFKGEDKGWNDQIYGRLINAADRHDLSHLLQEVHNKAALWSFPQAVNKTMSRVVRGGSDKPLKSRIFHLNWSQAMCRRLTTLPYWMWTIRSSELSVCAVSQWEVSSRGARLVWQMRPGRPGNLDPLYKDGQFWATQRLLPSATRQQRNTTTVWTIFFFDPPDKDQKMFLIMYNFKNPQQCTSMSGRGRDQN